MICFTLLDGNFNRLLALLTTGFLIYMKNLFRGHEAVVSHIISIFPIVYLKDVILHEIHVKKVQTALVRSPLKKEAKKKQKGKL